MSLEINTKKEGQILVVRVSGRIVYGDESNQLRDAVKEAIAAKPTGVVINLSQVPYIDSGGIGTVVGLYTSAHGAGIDLKLAGANAKVEQVLRITHLHTVIPVYTSEAQALASFGPQVASA